MILKKHRLSFVLISALTLPACGGSDDSTRIKTTNISTVTENSILQLEDSLLLNQAVDLILYYPNDKLTNIKWQQTSGATIDLLATSSKVLGFTPTISGNYSFNVSFSKNGGANQTVTGVNLLPKITL